MIFKEVAFALVRQKIYAGTHENRHKYMEDKNTAAEAQRGLCLYTHIHIHPGEAGGGGIIYHQDRPYCICHMDDAEEKTGGRNSTETKVDRRCRWTAEETSMFVRFGQESVPSQPIREKNEKTFRRKCWWRKRRQMKRKKCNSSSCSAKGYIKYFNVLPSPPPPCCCTGQNFYFVDVWTVMCLESLRVLVVTSLLSGRNTL